MSIDGDIDDYIRNYSSLHPKPPFFEEKGLLDGLNFYEDLRITEVFSTNIYPQRVEINGKYCLLWDNNFWDLYGRFLQGLMPLTKQGSSAKEIIDYFFGLFLLFLACRFDREPSLSYLFADFGSKTKLITQYSYECHVKTINTLGIFENIYFISKWFVFEHEALHHKYRIDKKSKDKESSIIIHACEFISKVSNYVDFIENDKERNLLASFFSHIKDDVRLIEELCCDVFALIKIIPAYAEIHSLPINKSFEECVQAARYITHFQSILNQIENHWKNSYNFVKKNILRPDLEFILEPIETKDLQLESVREGQITQYNMRQNYTILVTTLVFSYLGIDIADTTDKWDFFSTDAYKSFFVPMLDNTIIEFEFTNRIFLSLVDLYGKVSPSEYRNKRNLLIGWY